MIPEPGDDRRAVPSLAAFRASVFELEATIEMVFDGGFAAAGDHDDVGEAGTESPLPRRTGSGLVDKRQHLFGLGLGGGEEAGAEPAAGKNGFADFLRNH